VLGETNLASRVTSIEQPAQFHVGPVGEALVTHCEQPAGPVERIGLVAPMTERVLLDAAAGLVELGVRQLHHVERIGDLGGVGGVLNSLYEVSRSQ
jgi:hypothetical protein